MKFIITVDTEADDQWKNRGEISLENIKFLHKFQSLCEKYDFFPTYLVSYEVANDENSVKVLKEWLKSERCEIGAHLHPWTTPPYTESEKKNRQENAFPSELDDEVLKNKLISLTNKIKKSFEIEPKSFRAGRWGFDKIASKYLFDLEYKVDCSVTPKVSWKNFKGKVKGQGGPDFKNSSVYPGYLESGLLEAPITIIYTGIFKKEGILTRKFSTMPNSFIKKVLNKLFFQLRWCRIFPETTLEDLKKVYKSAKKNKLPVLEFMIHSSELMPGGSPYAKNKEAVERIYEKLEGFFKYLKKENIKGITLKQYEHKKS